MERLVETTTVGDRLLILFIIISSIVSIFFILQSSTESMEKYAVVQVGGIEIAEIPVNIKNQSKTYKFEYGENVGVLETSNGRIRMLPMDMDACPEGICSDTGWIEHSYQSIVCLPNKIVVTIENKENNDDLDMITRKLEVILYDQS